MERQVVLDRVTEVLRGELQESLTGIYLHGSMAMGCFNPLRSDVDILVIIKEVQSQETYRRIASRFIELEDELDIRQGFELSIVLERYATEFEYPTPTEFHYSLFHKEKYLQDENYLCGGFSDPDLAAHFVVTYQRGIVLFGRPIKEVFNPIDHRYYIESIKLDVEGVLEGIIENPVYYALNLSRVLLYLRESGFLQKRSW